MARYTRLRDLDARAGTLRFPRDTDVMHNFWLRDTRGQTIRNTNHEAHEQFVVHRFLRPDDTVIELGGGIGANSVQINLTLGGETKTRHFVVEPQRELVELIRENGRANGCRFRVLHGVLGRRGGVRVPPYDPDAKAWLFVRASASAKGPLVPSIRSLPIRPTVVVADCEGCLLQVLVDFPRILDNIRMVYFENDGGKEVLRGVQEALRERGMEEVVRTPHHRLYLLANGAATRPRRRSKSRR